MSSASTSTSTPTSTSSSSSSSPESWSTSLLKSFLHERGINTSLTLEKSELSSAAMTYVNMEERAIRECEQPTSIDIKDLSPSNAALRFEAHLTSILPKQIRATVTPVKQKRTGIISYTLEVTGQAMVATGSLWNAMIQAFLLAHTPTFTSVRNSIVYHPRRCPAGMSQDEFELTEFFDTERVIRAKVRVLARIMSIHKNTVVYTGAGVSTSAKIADFRGPNGVWTARDFNRPKAKSVPFEVAQPTLTHWMIKHGLDMGLFRYCTSQNVDGLHRRSGIPVDSLSELHGNCFREICASCGADHIRDFSTTSKKGPHFRGVQDKTKISHITGRKCETCGEGMLRDSVIHFHESLPARDLERSEQHARESYCSFVMGSSLRVTPAADLPALCRGPMIIVNLQATGRDQECLQSGGFIIHGKTDVVSALLLDALSIPISSIVPSSYEMPTDLAPTLLPIMEKQKFIKSRVEEEKEQTNTETSTKTKTSSRVIAR